LDFEKYFTWFASQILRWPSTDPTISDLDVDATLIWLIFTIFVFALGSVLADFFLLTRPISFEISARSTAWINLTVIVCGFMLLGFLPKHLAYFSSGYFLSAPSSLILGWLAMNIAARRDASRRTSTDSEEEFTKDNVIRPKQTGDLWIWVITSNPEIKSNFLSSVLNSLDDFCRTSYWSTTSPSPRSIQTNTGTVSEFGLLNGDQREARVRFWESGPTSTKQNDFPDASEMDGIVILLKPTELKSLSGSFPFGTTTELVEGNDRILEVARIIQQDSPDFISPVWLMIDEPNTLRFSTKESLIKFPIAIGPAWYEQITTMTSQRREELLEPLSLEKALDPNIGLNWGTGNPLFCFLPQSDFSELPFGGKEFLSFFLSSIPNTRLKYR
jgi:hypothetical protein